MHVGHEELDELLLDVPRLVQAGEARRKDVGEAVLVKEAAHGDVGTL